MQNASVKKRNPKTPRATGKEEAKGRSGDLIAKDPTFLNPGCLLPYSIDASMRGIITSAVCGGERVQHRI